MTLSSAPRLPGHRRATAAWTDVAAAAFGLVLSAYAVYLVHEQAVGVAATANELFFGHLFRCGAALPAVFYVAYLAGRAQAGRTRALVLAGVLASVVVQCLDDPRLGAPVIVVMAAVSGVFAGAGLLVRRRAELVAELRRRTRLLHEQREQTAALAVIAERARIGADISGVLRERIDEIGRLARPAPDGTARPEASFAAIELAGYRIVEQMLTVLRDDPAAQVDVRVCFAPNCLELRIAGPPAADCELRQLRSAVQARLALFGGSIDIDDSAGRRATLVRLPLVTSHA
jgi:hypothetical protein